MIDSCLKNRDAIYLVIQHSQDLQRVLFKDESFEFQQELTFEHHLTSELDILGTRKQRIKMQWCCSLHLHKKPPNSRLLDLHEKVFYR